MSDDSGRNEAQFLDRQIPLTFEEYWANYRVQDRDDWRRNDALQGEHARAAISKRRERDKLMK